MADQITVLVVEDEELIRMDIADYLEREGFKVFEAAHAYAAIELLEAHPSMSILFTDIVMPGSMDGLKLAVAVRSRWPPVKIVIVSGYRLIEITDMPDGGVFFSKPYTHGAVAAALRQLMADG